MKWNAVLFDLDDTLYSRSRAYQNTLKTLAETHISPPTGESVQALLDRFARWESNRRPGDSNKRPPEFIAEQIRINYPVVALSAEELAAWTRDKLLGHLTPDPAMVPISQLLDKRNTPWGVITNGDAFQLQKIRMLGVNIPPERIVVSDTEDWQKPSRELFEIAMAKLGVRSTEYVLMVGDDPVADIQGAGDAGLKTAWMSLGREWEHPEFKPDYRLDSLSELLPIIA